MFKNVFIIHLPPSLNSTLYNIEILDINGRIVYETILDSTNSLIKIENLSALEKAPYFLRISDNENENSVVKKLIKL